MGFFNSIKEQLFSDDGSDVFIYPPSKEPIQPEAYGFWTVGWSHELSLKLLEDIKNNNTNQPLPIMGMFYSYINLVAFYTAIHWVHAVVILQVPPETVEKMKIGLKDGTGSLSDQESNPLSEETKAYFKSSFVRYLDAIESDYRSQKDEDPSVFNPDVSLASAKFIEILEELPLNQENKITEIEKINIGLLLGDLPDITFTLMNTVGVKYLFKI